MSATAPALRSPARRSRATRSRTPTSATRRMSHARPVARRLGVGHILDGLGDRTRDTLVIYLSDNGFLFGEHRRFGKTDAYEESVRVPMVDPVSRTPRSRGRVRRSRARLERRHRTDARRARRISHGNADGRSFVPLLDGSAQQRPFGPADRALPRGGNAASAPCSGLSFYAHQTRAGGYWGVVTPAYKYVRYDTGDRELFDLEDGSARAAQPDRQRSGSTLDRRLLEAKLAALLRAEDVDTTIVTGPWPLGSPPSRMAAFTFFSPSRFSTYRCRLTRDGVPDAWHACDGQSDVLRWSRRRRLRRSRSPGSTSSATPTPTPARRSFTIASSGTLGLDRSTSAGRADRQGRRVLVLEHRRERLVRVPDLIRRRARAGLGSVRSGTRGRV